jgi:hypothetical protein
MTHNNRVADLLKKSFIQTYENSVSVKNDYNPIIELGIRLGIFYINSQIINSAIEMC